MGELMRRYWQPAALAEELPQGGAPLPVRLLGEDLALFRDDQGRPGLLAIHCSHRGADLSYGRVEDGGLRCIYHGWLYDIKGHCLEQPGEPAGSTFHERIRHRAYPCREVAGVILAYMGPGEPPLVPAYQWFTLPESHRFVTKIFQDCNHLHANEGNYDPVHLSFLHRQLVAPQHGPAAKGPDPASTVDAELTAFGVRVFGVRNIGPDQNYLTVRNFILPNMCATATAGVNWHVPIDDTHHWKYCIIFDPTAPLDRSSLWTARSETTGGYRLVRNRGNRYLQDREEMKTRTFAGLGAGFQAHDTCAVEGEGPIQDRTREHLGSGDQAIVLARRLLLKAVHDVQSGRDPPHVIRDPAANRFPELVSLGTVTPAGEDWHTSWQRFVPGDGEACVATPRLELVGLDMVEQSADPLTAKP